MKMLVTGVNGQLGYDVVNELKKRGVDCISASRNDFNITDFKSTEKFIEYTKPDIIIHCAAYTAVDKAEDEPDLCYKTNVDGTKNIAIMCKKIGAAMVYISSDYVFGGNGAEPYEINDITEPLGIYGKTKLLGENVVKELLEKYFIIRTSWVFGKNGNNFVKTMLKIGRERDLVRVVCDQIGSPTYTPDLARLICDMVETQKYGVYHATNEGYCSWADFAAEIFKIAGYNTSVEYIPTSEYPTKAVRPFNSRLSKKSLDKAGFKRLPDWKNALTRFLNSSNAL